MLNEDVEKELDALRENLPEVVETTSSKTAIQFYSQDLARRIADYRAQGLSLLAISLRDEMPAYNTLLRWRVTHPEFGKMLRDVAAARAGHFEDAAIQAAEDAQGKDADRLKFEAYKWAAEVNDPATYGKKVAHSGDVGGQVVLHVITGFGPPNKWQTPPKLKSDGTIDRTEIEVPSESADAQSSGETANGNQDASRASPNGPGDVAGGNSAD